MALQRQAVVAVQLLLLVGVVRVALPAAGLAAGLVAVVVQRLGVQPAAEAQRGAVSARGTARTAQPLRAKAAPPDPSTARHAQQQQQRRWGIVPSARGHSHARRGKGLRVRPQALARPATGQQ